MSQISSFVMIMVIFATTFSVAKSNLICNSETYEEGDPYGDSVAYVLAELANQTPSQDGFSYYNESPYKDSVAYGHATCILSLSKSECADCLGRASTIVSDTCSGHVGGQVEIVGCFIRYENYSFT